RGKVRDIYEIDSDRLLIIATDRLSAFDVVMAEGIPDIGLVLTQLSCFWFEFFRSAIPSHFLTANIADYPPELQPFSGQLAGRSMLVKKTKPLLIECVVRGYLAGSGWNDYRRTGAVCGHVLPAGLSESERLPEPICTPATKAAAGHDENIDRERAAELVGRERFEEVEGIALALYR